MQVPIAGQAFKTLDRYHRFNWPDIESGTGTYSWTKFDAQIKAAIDAGQKFSFRVNNLCPPEHCGSQPTVDGYGLTYPLYVHTQMQLETVKDWKYNGGTGNQMWIPNWNSPAYLLAWDNLLKAISNRLATQTYNGIRFKDAIGYIDIGGFGTWGEWHTYPFEQCNCFSNLDIAPALPTDASLNAIIDSSLNWFADYRLVALMATFATKSMSSRNVIGDAVACRVANASTRAGPVGWRRDMWAYQPSWVANNMDNNPVVCSGVPLKNLIMNKFRTAPIVGEPYGNITSMASGGDCPVWDLENQVRRYGVTSIGNGNWGGAESQECANAYARAASKAMGYRLVLTGGSYSATLASNRQLSVQLDWKNVGLTPTYESWNVTFELRNTSTTAVVWSGTSSMVLKHFIPETSSRSVVDAFNIPTSVPSGRYSLQLVIKDPTNYRKPLPLAIQGRATDGSYYLGAVQVP